MRRAIVRGGGDHLNLLSQSFGTFQKRLWVLNMLPAVVPPQVDTLGFESAANPNGRNVRQVRSRCYKMSQFGPTTTNQWYPLCLWQTTSTRSNLHARFRGKNDLALPNGVRRLRNSWQLSALATCAPADHRCTSRVQYTNCSTLDVYGQLKRSLLGWLRFALWYMHGQVVGFVLPLCLLIRSGVLVWNLSPLSSFRANLPHFLAPVNLGVNL